MPGAKSAGHVEVTSLCGENMALDRIPRGDSGPKTGVPQKKNGPSPKHASAKNISPPCLGCFGAFLENAPKQDAHPPWPKTFVAEYRPTGPYDLSFGARIGFGARSPKKKNAQRHATSILGVFRTHLPRHRKKKSKSKPADQG